MNVGGRSGCRLRLKATTPKGGTVPALLIALFSLVVLSLAVGYYFCSLIIYPKVTPIQQTYEWEAQAGKLVEAEYSAWPKEEIIIRSPFGYDLSGYYFPLAGSRRTVVIVHGITYSRFGSVKYMPVFRKRGFNVLIYDHRYHGRSGGPNCTFGYYEKHDLKAVVDWALARLGPGGTVGTHGESLGGATVLQHAALDERLAFVVADCPFSDLTEELRYRLKAEYHLPAFPLMPLANLFSRLITGMTFDQVSPIRDLPAVTTPVLLAHGLQDRYVLPAMSQALYAVKQRGVRQLYLVPEAKHAEAWWKNPAEYDRQVGEFLLGIGLDAPAPALEP
jgi:uncharacterized protein